MDFRGHGRSEKTELGHTFGQYAQEIRAFLEQTGIDDAVLAGWSMGAIVSWEYIHQFGTDRLLGLVDIDTEASPLKRDDDGYGSYGTEDLEGALDSIQTDPIGLLVERAAALLKDPPTREHRNLILDGGSRTPASIQRSLTLGMSFLRDYRDLLRAIDIPTLVGAGGDEKWRSVASQVRRRSRHGCEVRTVRE